MGTHDRVEAPEGVRVRRPDRKLLHYYVLNSLLLGPLFPFFFLPFYFRYRTLQYEFDDEGVTMRWGRFFRRTITLTYARIQDIHLISNVVERWLGLARIQIQTASGSATAEMTIEGLTDFEEIRRELYLEMRGVTERDTMQRGEIEDGGLSTLRTAIEETTVELRRLRESLAAHASPASGGHDDTP